MKFSSNTLFATAAALVLGLTSCQPDDDFSYTVPETYNFENVSYTGQSNRLDMMAEITTYIKTAHVANAPALDAAKIKDMYGDNTGNHFSTSDLNSSTKQLKSKTVTTEQANFESYMDAVALASQSTNMTASDGQAGIAANNAGTKFYLLNEHGIEFAQVIEKGLMGACFYYQGTSVYMGAGKMDVDAVDNTTVVDGEGTEMEHHWDEAFGYFSVPTDFPTNTDGLAFWGDYSNDRDMLLGTNATIMDNFLKGRAAISNNDLTARDEAIIDIQAGWELVSVGTAIHYINSALDNFSDDALRNHALSEAAAFVYALNFNPNKKVTTSNIEDLLVQIGGDKDFVDMNFYLSTEADLNAAKDALATYYSLEEKKDDL